MFFVAMTLAGVTKLVGTDEEGGSIKQATAGIVAPRPQAAEPAPTDSQAEQIIVAMPSDEDLIDPATGYDPTPPEEFVDGALPDDGEVVIVAQDSTETQEATTGQQ